MRTADFRDIVFQKFKQNSLRAGKNAIRRRNRRCDCPNSQNRCSACPGSRRTVALKKLLYLNFRTGLGGVT
jgi:hypothetical protein